MEQGIPAQEGGEEGEALAEGDAVSINMLGKANTFCPFPLLEGDSIALL